MRHFLSRNIFRTLALLSLVSTLCFAAACEGIGEDEDLAAESTAEPAVDDGEDSTTSAEAARDVLFTLFAAFENEDFQSIYDHLVSNFHIIPFDPDADERQKWIPGIAPRNHPAMRDDLDHPGDDPESWQVEEHDGFVIVRHREVRYAAHVFREENGEWRLDPGEVSLVRAWEYSLPEDQLGSEGSMATSGHHQWESEDDFVLPPPIMYGPATFTVHDGYADATFSWVIGPPGRMFGDFNEYLHHDILIELDELAWNLDGETGPVKIVWTNAILEDDYLRLPALPEQMVDAMLGAGLSSVFGQFEATMRLLDLPDGADESDEVVLQTGNVQIGPMGEGAPAGVDEPLHIRYEHYIPMTSSTRILTGDIPERSDADPAVEISPVPPDEVPPGPDPAELMSIVDIDYDREGDHVSALVYLDTGGINPDWGREVEVHWSDGEMTIFAPEQLVGQEIMELPVERADTPDGVEVDALHFDYIIFDLEPDSDAMVYEDRIETVWGDFPLGNIVEATDGSGFASYAAAGRRFIHTSSLDHNGESIRFSTASYGLGEDLIPEGVRLQFQAGFVDAREDVPLPAEVQVREIAGDVVVSTHP